MKTKVNLRKYKDVNENRQTPSDVLKKLFFLILVAIIASSLTAIVYKANEAFSIYYFQEFDAKFKVSNKLGLSADSDKIDFGSAPEGSTSRRELLLYHEFERPLKVKVSYSGNIADILSPIKPFYLEPKKEQKIGIIANAFGEEGTEYSGKIKVSYLKS